MLRPSILVFSALASSAFAQDWGALATISSTMGTNPGRLCIAEGTRGDIGCPPYAPNVTTAGHVSITGNLSAATFIGDGSNLTNVPNATITLTGNVTGSGTNTIATTIANNAVTTARIADNAVTTAKINTSAVTANELASNAVTTAKVADDAITSAKLAANAVDSSHIVNGTILAADISTSAITTVKIADNAITAAKIATNAVTSNELASGAVLTTNLVDSAVTLPKLQNISTNRLLGRASTGTGDVQQITVGSGLSFSGTTLSADGGSLSCTTVASASGGQPKATCASGYTMTGGGCNGDQITRSFPSGNGWQCYFYESGGNPEGTTYARCCKL